MISNLDPSVDLLGGCGKLIDQLNIGVIYRETILVNEYGNQLGDFVGCVKYPGKWQTRCELDGLGNN